MLALESTCFDEIPGAMRETCKHGSISRDHTLDFTTVKDNMNK